MLKAHARALGALILGAALALPMAATAQAPAQTPGKQSAGELGKSSPTTAPTRDAGRVPTVPQTTADAPKVASPPAPGKGSTAVPGWNNPPAWGAASEQRQYASVPGVDTNILINSSGREWRAFRNGPLTTFGGWILVGVLAVIAVFYLIKGPMKVHGAPTGRLIERFNAIERVTHWVLAIAFVILSLSGIIILWGKHIVLPWLGYTGFSWLTIVSKNLHNFIGPLFIFSLIVLFLLFVKDNFINAVDIKWLSRAGGMLGGPEMPSGRFNGGEKVYFWLGLVLAGAAVSVTGLILDFPNWNQGRDLMQQANVIHAIAAVFFMVLAMGHTYLGTIGVQGAYRAMRDGYVDEQWAKEHHVLWYEEVKAGKRRERILPGNAAPVAGDD